MRLLGHQLVAVEVQAIEDSGVEDVLGFEGYPKAFLARTVSGALVTSSLVGSVDNENEGLGERFLRDMRIIRRTSMGARQDLERGLERQTTVSLGAS